MARSIISVIVVGLLVVGLAVPVYALEPVYDFNDSGVQLFNVQRSSEAVTVSDDVSVAAEVLDDGNGYGLKFESYPADITYSTETVANGTRSSLLSPLSIGKYVVTFTSSLPIYNEEIRVWSYNPNVNGQISREFYIDGNSCTVTFDITSENVGNILIYAWSDPFDAPLEDFYFYDVSYKRIVPVSGISSGFTYNSGIMRENVHQFYETLDVQFGDQPAGDYLINVYHWGQSYVADFYPAYNGRRLATSTNGGVTTFTVSHGGGDLSISGGVSIYRTTSREVIGLQIGGGDGNLIDGTGYINGIASRLDLSEPGSWTFNIVDVVATRLEESSVDQFGIFGPVVGFFRDQFGDIQSFISSQFSGLKSFFTDLFSADDNGEFEQGSTEADSLVSQNQQLEDEIFADFDSTASAVDPSVVTIPNDVLSGFGFLGDLFMLTFNGLGNYQVLVYLPLMIGICSIVTGRGFTSAMRSHRSGKGE